MYYLIIDGEVVQSEEVIKPLIEELDLYARSTDFIQASIVKI